MAAPGAIRFDALALRVLLSSSDGPVGRNLAQRAIRVESSAKLHASGRPGPNVQTGRLRSSITWALGRDEAGLFADIGSNVEYAAYVENGTDRAPAYPYLKPALPAAGG
jgi:phage gpG-like protein